jgi:hypothetical protein
MVEPGTLNMSQFVQNFRSSWAIKSSIVALANAENLVSKATETKSFPGKLSSDYQFLTDVSNYLTDLTLPDAIETGQTYCDLVKAWGNLLWKNKGDILQKKFDFSPIKETPVTNTLKDGWIQTIFVWEGNSNPDLKKALDVLKNYNGPQQKPDTVDKKTN